MIRGGKPKLVAALALLVGLGLGSAGCQSRMGSCAPVVTGTGCSSCPAGQSLEPAAGNRQSGNGYLPGVIQKTGYMGEDAKGQPVVGQIALASFAGDGNDNGFGSIPTEINRVSLPPYTVAPPDILLIDATRLVPRPPYRIEPLEVLFIQVTNTLPSQPINSSFAVSPEGTVNLGFGYGSVPVQGLNVAEIQGAITKHLSKILRDPQVSVTVQQFRGQHQVHGDHLVRPDGTISLGTYGSVYVAGFTIGQVRQAIEKHLKDYVSNPQVAVDVYAYNSKFYYVVFDGGGYGQQVYPLPVTGNETVLDAIGKLGGLPPVSSQIRMWVARPGPANHPCDQILPVDWEAIVKGGSTRTNYQLFPGDRVYVGADPLIENDLWLAKFLAPIERILGITLLGSSTVNSIRNSGITNGTVISH